jgi:hypothetical protein
MKDAITRAYVMKAQLNTHLVRSTLEAKCDSDDYDTQEYQSHASNLNPRVSSFIVTVVACTGPSEIRHARFGMQGYRCPSPQAVAMLYCEASLMECFLGSCG